MVPTDLHRVALTKKMCRTNLGHHHIYNLHTLYFFFFQNEQQPHYHFPIMKTNRTNSIYVLCSTKQQQTTAFPCIIIINSIMCETLTVNGFNPHTQQIHQFEQNTNSQKSFYKKKKKANRNGETSLRRPVWQMQKKKIEDISSLASINSPSRYSYNYRIEIIGLGWFFQIL